MSVTPRIPFVPLGPLAVAGEVVAYSRTIALPNNPNAKFALEHEATGATVNVKLEAEYGFRAPATEGAADGNFVVVGSAIATIAKPLGIVAFSPTSAPFMRIKATGLSGNTSDAVVSKLNLSTVYG